MNWFLVTLSMSVLWILFSQLNELRGANEGCCRSNTCGKHSFDKFLWNGTLSTAIIFTLLFLYKLYMLYARTALMATPQGRVFNAVNQGVEMMFG